MAGTVTTDLVFFTGATGGSSSADALTDWTGTGLVVDTVAFVQGTGSIYTYSAASTTERLADFACVATDIQNKVIYFWFALGKVGFLNTKATGGLRVRVEDASANWGEWYIAGSDTLPHNGFLCHPVHTNTAYDANSATLPNKAAITKICIRAYGSFPGKSYTWVDAVRIGTYVQIKAGTEASPATFADIITAEETTANRWGILSKTEGVLFCQGLLLFGSITAAEATYFKDTSKVLVFSDKLVPADYFEMKIQGNATGTTQIYFGIESGGRGISGCVFRSAGAAKFKLTATDANITDLGIYGCTLFDTATISLPAYSITRKVLDCTFEKCGEVVVNTCTVKYCNFVSSDGSAALISSIGHNTTNCNFINCPEGVKLNTYDASAYPFSALIFTGTTYHVNNISGSTLTVGNANGSNASTYTGTLVNFTGSVDLTMTVKNQAGTAIVGAWAFIDQDPPVEPWIMNMQTIAGGIASVSHTLGPVTGSIWRIRKYGYKDFEQIIDIGSVDISLPVTLIVDPQQT